jgi:stage V sporulation protein SpoVS
MVHAICVGVASNYNATKAIIMARGQLQMVGKEMNFEPYFMDVTIEDKNGINEGAKKTAVRWEMTLK